MKTGRRLLAALLMIVLFVGMLPVSASAENASPGGEIVDAHDPQKHAAACRITREYGQNTIYIQCEWEEDDPAGVRHVCQFRQWPLLIMDRPDTYYDGTPCEAGFCTEMMRGYPNGDTVNGFPDDYAEWDGKFTYTGINGTVEYGPTTSPPIGEGTYSVQATVRIPAAAAREGGGTFVLSKEFTIIPSAYNLTFDANVPRNASTGSDLSGRMPEMHFNSYVDSRVLPPNQFILPGYNFDSWNTEPDGTGERYENNAKVKGISKRGRDVTLFAQWKPKTYEIMYCPGDAIGDNMMEEAVFDRPGTLRAVSEMGWSYDDRIFQCWATDNRGLMLDDEAAFVNIYNGSVVGPGLYDMNPGDVELTAQWTENGQIVASVTKDGVPQEGLAEGFFLKSESGQIYTMSASYSSGVYTFDPSKSSQQGGTPGPLPHGEYDFCFEIEPYPQSSIHFIYDGSAGVSAFFDYCTVSMVKNPAFADACNISMEPDSGACMETVPASFRALARDGAQLKLKTVVADGYQFDGYSATGTAPLWEGGDPTAAEQTVEVRGRAEIMANVRANSYTVHFDANTKAAVIGAMEDQKMVYNEPQNLFANQFVCGGAVFTGWNTKQNGSGESYGDKQSVKNLTSENNGEITLYAQWGSAGSSVTVTADNATKVYGEADPELTATIEGLAGGDTVSWTISREDGENAGTYVITPSGEKIQGGYQVSYRTGTFTIKKAPLSLGLSIEGWTEGKTANAPVLTGNSGGSVTYKYKPKTADDSAYSEEVPAAAGEYIVLATVGETPNYLGGEKTAAFTIKPASPVPVTVKEVRLNSAGGRKEYSEGDALDVSGLTLTVSKSDGSTETVPVTPEMISGFDSTKPGRQTLTVTYGGFTATFEVEVKAKPAPKPDPKPDPKPTPEPESGSDDEPEPEPARVPYYSVKDGAGNAISSLTWHKGSVQPLTVIVNRSENDSLTYEQFYCLMVDGKTVDETQYVASAGSLKLSIRPEFLETLRTGDHYTWIGFDDGSAALNIEIAATGTQPDAAAGTNPAAQSPGANPTQTNAAQASALNANTPNTKPLADTPQARTGDSSNPALYGSIMLAALAMLAALLYSRRYSRR